jgi:poly-gamma-glutamate capsule biosynthesis protein CapA/YwtB (metallophosphatase superfamily)
MPTLFLCGDVMTGRGIDQILASPCPPGIQEPYVCDARDYVVLAEEANGPIAHPVAPAYIWGDALAEVKRVAPDARIINLETSITTCDDFWPGKGIHYRMHPRNVDCLTAAAVDVCVLANNHVLDYGRAGLDQTIVTLIEAGLKVAGAGASIHQRGSRQSSISVPTDGFWCSRPAPRIAAFLKPGRLAPGHPAWICCPISPTRRLTTS